MSIRPRSSSGSPNRATTGCGLTPAVQTSVRVGTTSPSLSRGAARRDLVERRLRADLDAARAQLADGEVGELRADLRHHALGRLDEDPAHAGDLAARVEVHDVGGEVLQLGEPLEARVAGADEDVGEVLAARVAVLERLGDLERADDVVAQRDRLGQRLQRHAVLGEAGDRQRAADGAERDDELVVAAGPPRCRRASARG